MELFVEFLGDSQLQPFGTFGSAIFSQIRSHGNTAEVLTCLCELEAAARKGAQWQMTLDLLSKALTKF